MFIPFISLVVIFFLLFIMVKWWAPRSILNVKLDSFEYILYTQHWCLGAYGSCRFTFLSNIHTEFYCNWFNLLSSNNVSIPIPSVLISVYLLFDFLLIALLTRVRWNLDVHIFCISLLPKDAEHFFLIYWPLYELS